MLTNTSYSTLESLIHVVGAVPAFAVHAGALRFTLYENKKNAALAENSKSRQIEGNNKTAGRLKETHWIEC